MNDLEDLYREMIIEHKKNPRNYCRLAEPTHKSEGHNPVCGDQLTVYLRIEDDVLKEVGFEGQGCAVSTASASIMTERLKGLSLAGSRYFTKPRRLRPCHPGPISPQKHSKKR